MKINCIEIANKIQNELVKEIEQLKKENIIPKLVIFKNNEDKASDRYVNFKLKKAEELKIQTVVYNDYQTQDELINQIKKANIDKSIHGYIVQLPLPKGFDQKKIFEYIDVNKDIDGLSPLSVYRNYNNNNHTFYPKACTAYGIIEIIKSVYQDISYKNVVIINRSLIVGKPLSCLLINEDATVTMCHSKTKDLKAYTLNADIVIVAVGKPNFLTEDMINNNCFLIDAGINVVDNKVVGDISNQANLKAKYFTPVPNGVGKLTVIMIFKNLIDLIKGNK